MKEELEKLDVEFLPGVPVKLPPATIEAIINLFDKEKKKATENMNYMFPRAMGKTAHFTDIFLKECKAKKTAEYHHPDYVVMSRKQYEKITQRAKLGGNNEL